MKCDCMTETEVTIIHTSLMHTIQQYESMLKN